MFSQSECQCKWGQQIYDTLYGKKVILGVSKQKVKASTLLWFNIIKYAFVVKQMKKVSSFVTKFYSEK